MVVNYELGKIYVLRSHKTDKIYIGSTAQKLLSTRLGGHKRNYKRWLNGKDNYTTSFELIKYDDCYIELLQEYPCENRHQLCKKEGEYIRKMNCVNKLIAGRTNREWHQDNKENIQEYQKQYHQVNQQKIKERTKQYYQENKDKLSEQIKQYHQVNRKKISEQQKQYRQNNKGKMAEQQKQYYQDNKDKILEYKK